MVSHNRPVLPLSMVITETDKTFVEHIIRTEPNATRMATTFYFQHEPNTQQTTNSPTHAPRCHNHPPSTHHQAT